MNTAAMVNERSRGSASGGAPRQSDPTVMVIFGASGDLTKRLLMPALYNLYCDGLLGEGFVIAGIAMDELTTEQYRERISSTIRQFSTRREFDEAAWERFVKKLHYMPGQFQDFESYRKLALLVSSLDVEYRCGGNVLFYFATPPSVFTTISAQLQRAGFQQSTEGWRRIIVEKPFGHDLVSAQTLNRDILKFWSEDQVFRIDHYLGKETVQNLLAFRFSNGIFEPLWNRNYVDHIQFSVAELVGVETRGGYYESAGVLRDMIQNHMLQMLAYLCMEPPSSFKADAIRNEKYKVLDAIRVMTPEEVLENTVRGQYGPGRRADGFPARGYREEPAVSPASVTETFAAIKLYIDNWRWEGVPIYLRSGKSLWKRGTEILVQFKKAPEVIFRDTPEVDHLNNNQLVFHVQPDQGIEFRFHAKRPGPSMSLQPVNMRFDYSQVFEASRATGYEVLIYNCMIGDATLFSRSDLVEAAWRVAQPILDTWAAHPAKDFPNYAVGSLGPKSSFDLLEKEGRRWLEVINRSVLERVPLFENLSSTFLHGLALMLKPDVYEAGDMIIRMGEEGREMYFIGRGEVEVVDGDGNVVHTMTSGDFFGETSLLSQGRRTASVRAKTHCDVFILERGDFHAVLRDHPSFARAIRDISDERAQRSAAVSGQG